VPIRPFHFLVVFCLCIDLHSLINMNGPESKTVHRSLCLHLYQLGSKDGMIHQVDQEFSTWNGVHLHLLKIYVKAYEYAHSVIYLICSLVDFHRQISPHYDGDRACNSTREITRGLQQHISVSGLSNTNSLEKCLGNFY